MPIVLTADICAHGVIAAARFLLIDPVRAMEAKRGRPRVAVSAAGLAVHDLTGLKLVQVARIFGLNSQSLSAANTDVGGTANRARAHARQAMVAAGLDLSGALPFPAEPEAPRRRPRPTPTPQTVPPTPAAPALETVSSPRADHTPAIREALARRASLPAAPKRTADACRWPLDIPDMKAEPLCRETRVLGRLFCPKHCRAVGQKDTPVDLSAPVLPASYRDPRADDGVSRQAAR